MYKFTKWTEELKDMIKCKKEQCNFEIAKLQDDITKIENKYHNGIVELEKDLRTYKRFEDLGFDFDITTTTNLKPNCFIFVDAVLVRYLQKTVSTVMRCIKQDQNESECAIEEQIIALQNNHTADEAIKLLLKEVEKYKKIIKDIQEYMNKQIGK